MDNFVYLLMEAKNGDTESMSKIMELYKALIYKESVVNGVFDPDLNQLLYKTLYVCILRLFIRVSIIIFSSLVIFNLIGELGFFSISLILYFFKYLFI